jgi:glycosyltransferase involved in cell wall biosynthesis
VIPNGVDLASFAERDGRRPVRTIITVANLRPEKSHETLIAAAAMLVRGFPHLRFLIVGDGPRRAELEGLTRARGLDAHVEFLGHREDVAALLQQADVFVLPSRSEAFPNGAIEAMAAGLPVVACAVGGLLELIENDRTGVLVPPTDPDRLMAAISRLIRQPARAAAIGSAAREEVRRRYTFERMVATFEDLYVSSLQGRPAAAAGAAEAAGI